MDSIVPARINVGNHRQSVLPSLGDSTNQQENDAEFRLPDRRSQGRNENEGDSGDAQAASTPVSEGASQAARDRRAEGKEDHREEAEDSIGAAVASTEKSRPEKTSEGGGNARIRKTDSSILATTNKELRTPGDKAGMGVATGLPEMNRPMPITSDNANPRWLLAPDRMPRQIVKAAALVQQAIMPRTVFNPRKELDRKEAPALPPASNTQEFSSQAQTSVQRAEAPPQAVELNPLLLRAIDRLREGNHQTLRIAMRVTDGSLLNVQLSYRGGSVRATFRTSDKALQQSIEHGWGALVREASQRGVQLETPEFETAPSKRLAENHYA